MQPPEHLNDLAQRYTAAWCSQDPASVAAFFSPSGSLRVNDAEPAVGRSAITELVPGFMTAFPDLKVTMDSLLVDGGRTVYRWALTGTNAGPGGGRRRVRISGFEEWRIGSDGLIAESQGHFDAAAYQHQLQYGVPTPRVFNEDEVRGRLRMPELIDAMERALVEFSAGRVQQPVRTVFGFGTEPSFFGLMPAYVPSLPALGAKLVTVCPGNTERDLGT